MMVIGLVIGLLVGAGITYVIIKPKLNEHHQINEEIQQQNENLQMENKILDEDIAKLTIKKGEMAESIKLMQWQLDQAKESQDKMIQEYYDKAMELTNERIDKATEDLALRYQKYEEEARIEYENILSSLSSDTLLRTQKTEEEYNILAEKLKDIRNKVNAATAEAKRHAEEKDNQNFYRICLTANDLEEIKKLKEVAQYLRNEEPLNKVIWKVYYENPTSELIGRVVGSGVHTGIYKITDIESKRCYVGQSANIAERFKQHIKRGLGAEAPTKNKLYPAMASIGVENFTFEVIEECERSQLDEKEDYWQDFYNAITFGFSIK